MEKFSLPSICGMLGEPGGIMSPILYFWLPIILAAIAVFFVSSIIHMLLPYHRSDFKKLPSEDETMAALRPFSIPPGDYVMPHAGSPSAMKDPAYLKKVEEGPLAFMTVLPSGISMIKSLFLWFLYCGVVSLFAAYITSRAVGPDPTWRAIFRFSGAVAFIGYSLALWQNTIWYHRPVCTTMKSTFDGLIYAMITAGIFVWLWT